MDILILIAAFVIILFGAELFTNGIEWFGRKLELAEGAVGSVLAAVGTALPETMIPIIAILAGGGSESSHGVGVGAILGAPFMLSTLAMFVTGVAVLIVARRRPMGDVMPVDTGVLAHDMRYFAIAYGLAIGAAFLPLEPTWLKWIVAAVLIGIYVWYVKGHFEADPSVDVEDLAPLRFRHLDPGHTEDPAAPPRLRVVNVQVIAALGLIIVGAYFFVGAVEHLATSFGLDEALLALVIAPIATELPEKFNSVIWVRQGKDTLAMGNITGAMVFQSTIPTVVALLFAADAWHFDEGSRLAFASAGIAFISSALIFIPMARAGRLTGRRLLVGGVFYLIYLVAVIAAPDGRHLGRRGEARRTPSDRSGGGAGRREAPRTPSDRSGGGAGRRRLSLASSHAQRSDWRRNDLDSRQATASLARRNAGRSTWALRAAASRSSARRSACRTGCQGAAGILRRPFDDRCRGVPAPPIHAGAPHAC